MILFATDLDNTMIYSYKKEIPDPVLVEEMDGKALSYMTGYACEKLNNLPPHICFVPVTTRSLAQYRRIRIPGLKHPEYALVSNGGILLRNGEPDPDWYEVSIAVTKAVDGEFEKAKQILNQDENLTLDIRMVDDLFLFTKSSQKEQTVKRLTETLDLSRVDVHSNGQKIYVIPKGLNKGSMLKRLVKKLGSPYTIGCGDSLFDIPLLLAADLAICPEELNQGELAQRKEYRTVAAGQMLSDEIFRYLDTLQPCGNRSE